MDFGLNRIARLPPAPYDSGPTLSDHTQVLAVDPAEVDARCRAMNAALPQGLQAQQPGPHQAYRECYDPWNDVGIVPQMPNADETERLRQHMLGHARGGTHGMGLGEGPWWDAGWKRFYEGGSPHPAGQAAVQTAKAQGHAQGGKVEQDQIRSIIALLSRLYPPHEVQWLLARARVADHLR